MQLDPDDITMIITRLRRGQRPPRLRDADAGEGAKCQDALTRLAAVGEAASRGGYALVATGLEQCLAEDRRYSRRYQKLEMLFVTLASYGVTWRVGERRRDLDRFVDRMGLSRRRVRRISPRRNLQQSLTRSGSPTVPTCTDSWSRTAAGRRSTTRNGRPTAGAGYFSPRIEKGQPPARGGTTRHGLPGESAQLTEHVSTWLTTLPAPKGSNKRLGRLKLDIELPLRTFGQYVAESEGESLTNYFVPTNEFEAVVAGRATVFVSRKGTGKTASMQQAVAELRTDRRILVVPIKPSSYDLAGLIAVLQRFPDSAKREYFLLNLWSHLLCTEMAIRAIAHAEDLPAGLDADANIAKLAEELKRLDVDTEGDPSSRLDEAIAGATVAARRATEAGPGGQGGATGESSAVGSGLLTDTSDQPLPGPQQTTLRPAMTARNRRLEPASWQQTGADMTRGEDGP